MVLSQLQARQQQQECDPNDSICEFLQLLQNPFQTQLQVTSIYSSLIFSFGVSAGIIALFCLIRPRNNNVYAPRAKHADKKHAPPPVGRGIFDWISPIIKVKEAALVEEVGVDAVVFLRFLKMTRNIFLCLVPLAFGMLVPITLTHTATFVNYNGVNVLLKMTPMWLFGDWFWAYVVFAYAMTLVVVFFLYINYRVITRLRRSYFDSQDYQNSLHSRTLMVRHIPSSMRTDDGLVQLVEKAKHTDTVPRTSIARNTKDLPNLLEEYEESVQKLEGYLAGYLANPEKLPINRPMCKPQKNDKAFKGQSKVDAIDYHTARVKLLECEIKTIRETVDRRHPLPYGFVSYPQIEDAHAVAWASRKGGPEHTQIVLAPKPNDLIWKNLPITRAARRRKSVWFGLFMVILTIAYIPPNMMISIFLSNLSNLGLVWHSFGPTNSSNKTWRGIVQGIAAPSLQQLFYLILPTIFRRLSARSGDITKTQRERHVLNRLFAFFVFNNLVVFTCFSSLWAFIAAVINSKDSNVWNALKGGHLGQNLSQTLCGTSTYWVTYQLQRNLSAAIDLAQGFTLVSNFLTKHFSNPTPRQAIELSAPQPFLYADYYNATLFVATAGLAFGAVQPIILPIVAFYVGVDAWFKKYLLQYVFITKIESGGAFWGNVFNRYLFAVLLADAVIALLTLAHGSYTMLFAMIPLLFIIFGFKLYCVKMFDRKFKYYSIYSIDQLDAQEASLVTGDAKQQKRIRKTIDRVGVKFGHPALYLPLMKPMVHAKAQHLLKEVLRGAIDTDEQLGGQTVRPRSMGNYSDIYMTEMSETQAGKHAALSTESATPQFEIVKEADLDFENFKRRAEFRAEFGGDGELYGTAESLVDRPGTPSSASIMSMSTLAQQDRGRRAASPASTIRGASQSESRSGSKVRQFPPGLASAFDGTAETTYAPGYAGLRHADESPERAPLQKWESADIAEGRAALLDTAAHMGRGGVPGGNGRNYFDIRPSVNNSIVNTPADGMTPMLDEEDETSYDYFRQGGAGRR